MSKPFRPFRCALGSLLLLLGAMIAAHSAPSITSQLDRDEINFGESVQLTVTVTEGNGGDIAPPDVPGLDVQSTEQSEQIEMINGQTTSSIAFNYVLVPQHPGVFTIPAPTAGGKPLTLRVRASNGSVPAGGNANSAPGNLPNPNIRGSEPDNSSASTNTVGFARLILPKNQLYVGEMVPAEVQIGLRANVVNSVRGLEPPNFDGMDAFSINKLSDKPEQTQQDIGDQQYLILTYRTTVTALKPGNSTAKIAVPMTVLVRTNRDFSGNLPSDLMDPAILQALGGVEEKRIVLNGDPQTLTVSALPTEGRPDDFSGAVGAFTVSAALSDSKSNFGDPVTLRMKVSGTGNFERVSSPLLSSNNTWKTYKPTSSFTPSDSVGFSGDKNFEQAVIALNSGSQTIPPLSFSYFNPETRTYETKQTASLPLEIAAPPVAPPSASPSSVLANVTPSASTLKSETDWRSDHVVTEGTVSTLCPLFFQPWFLGTQAGLILVFGGAWAWSSYREREAGDLLKVQQKKTAWAIQQALSEMQSALAAGNAEQFFVSARGALQQQLAQQWKLSPGAITLAEVKDHYPVDDHPICQIFSLADQVAYSGQAMSTEQLAQWSEVVQNELRQSTGVNS